MAEPCEKTTYKTERLAQTEARRLSDASGEWFRHYLCPACKRWHLTTNGSSNEAPRGRRGPFQKHWPKRAHTAEEMEALAKQIRDRRMGVEVSDG